MLNLLYLPIFYHMKHINLLMAVALLLCVTTVSWAQSFQVSGQVTSAEDSNPIPGVNVIIKGTSTGTATDFDGNFSLSVPNKDAVLQISFIGYTAQEVVVGNQTTISIQLAANISELNEVVVTALGIERSEESLTYSMQSIDSEGLTMAKDPNVANSLSGRVAGMQLQRSGSGAGGSVKINLRGNRSATGNNSPLVVVDGMPIAGSGSQQPGSLEDPGRDGGDGLSNINPEDIASINVLKGAAASALYGSQAANGVLLITTKRAKAGKTKVSFSSNFMSENAYLYPEMQTSYDANGVKLTGEKPFTADEFYRTGTTFVNSISLASGTDQSNYYVSYANTSANGIMPTNEFGRHNFSFNSSQKMFNDRLTFNTNAMYITQKGTNRPSSGTYMNPIYNAYLTPRTIGSSVIRDQYEVFDPGRNIYVQNWDWSNIPSTIANENPYWVLNRAKAEEERQRLILFGTAKYKITDWMNIQGRASVDRTKDIWSRNVHATTNSVYFGNHPDTELHHGGYFRDDFLNQQLYGDLMLDVNKKINDFTVVGVLGTAIRDEFVEEQMISSGKKSIEKTNMFTVSNLPSGMVPVMGQAQRQVQSVFASANIGYKEMLFLDVTGRNDWSSTLPAGSNSYFYPSVGLTGVINNMTELPESISLLKVRANYTMLGNDAAPGLTVLQHTFDENGNFVFADTAPFEDLKPELSTSIELGGELEMYNGRLYVDFNLYKTNTVNQLFRLLAPTGSKYTYQYVNAGNIENRGFELAINAMPVSTDHFTWSTGFNFGRNINEIKELYKDSNGNEVLTEIVTNGGNTNYNQVLRKGGMIGDIVVADFIRDENGKIAYATDDEGNQLNYPAGAGATSVSDGGVIANSNPKLLVGWTNNISYKGVSLSMVIDGRFGGQVLGMTDSYMDALGTSARYADVVGNPDRSITVEGQEFNEKNYLNSVAGRAGVTSDYLFDATNVRLRELSIGYTFNKLGPLDNLTISAVGRNLFFFYNAAPFDPDLVVSSGGTMQGIQMFGLPTTRSLGFNVRVNF